MELSPEEYEAKKLLAQIGGEIAKGRAELSNLREQKQSFLDKQAEETEKVINSVLHASKTALAEADKYRDELQGFHRDLVNFNAELEEWQKSLAAEEIIFIEKRSTFEEQASRREEHLEKLTSDLKIRRELLEADRLTLNATAQRLNDKEKRIASDRTALDEAAKHLSKKYGRRL